MNTYTRWTYAPDPGSPEKCGQHRPRAVLDGDGNIVLGVPDAGLQVYGWYPERAGDALPPYNRGWLPMTRVDTGALEAYYVPDLPPEPERVAMALQAMEQRVDTERNRLVGVATTGMDPPPMEDIGTRQRAALMQVAQLQRRESRGLATPGEIAVLDMMDEIPGQVLAVDQARAAIVDWARRTITTISAADALDARQPPPECPQWPSI